MKVTQIVYWVVAVVAFVASVFNAFQIIVIIAGQYNRSPLIESPFLATLDATFPTSLWLIISLSALVVVVLQMRSTARVLSAGH